VLLGNRQPLAGVRDEDEALAGYRDEPWRVIDVGHEQLAGEFVLSKLHSPLFEDLLGAQPLALRRGEQARQQRPHVGRLPPRLGAGSVRGVRRQDERAIRPLLDDHVVTGHVTAESYARSLL